MSAGLSDIFYCCRNQQVLMVSRDLLGQPRTSGLLRARLRTARSEPMPSPGPTESFYTLSSLLSQFYPPLFRSILIGHSSLERICTLEALSVIPYHPQVCLSLTNAPTPLIVLLPHDTSLTHLFHLSVAPSYYLSFSISCNGAGMIF